MNKTKNTTETSRYRAARFALRGLLLSACFSAVAQAQTVLRYSDHQPLGQMRTDFLQQEFFKAIEAESKGKIKIEDHWDGEVAVAYDALGAVRAGEKTDIATVVPEYTAKDLPLHQIFKGFPTGPAATDQVAFFREVYKKIPEFQQELDKNNLQPIFFGTGYPAGFFSTKHLTHAKQIAGGAWRSASFWHLDFMSNAGATPVRMHWGPEIYTALENGTLDGILVNVDSAFNLDLHKTAKFARASQDLWLGHLYIVAMNQDAWEKLSPKEKRIIERAANKTYKRLGRVMQQSYAAMVKKIEADGAQVEEMSKAEIADWGALTQYEKVQEDWAKQQKADGVENAMQVIEKVRKLHQEYFPAK